MLVRLLLRSLRLAVMASRFVSSTFGISTSTESGNASEMSLSTSFVSGRSSRPSVMSV